jgi:hypothetical protein
VRIQSPLPGPPDREADLVERSGDPLVATSRNAVIVGRIANPSYRGFRPGGRLVFCSFRSQPGHAVWTGARVQTAYFR